MTINRYFTNFPTIEYNSANAVNITERVVFLNNALKNPYVFYPYTITENERADQFANRYYNDSFKSWILYLGNQIIDPYYGWYLTINEFNEFLNKKYASKNPNSGYSGLQLAQLKTKYYQNNWYDSESLTVGGFDALPYNLQKYWQPVYGSRNNIIKYVRSQLDQIATTNSIRSYTVANTSFINDEICEIVFDNNGHVGQGQILSVNSDTNTIYLQHITGVSMPYYNSPSDNTEISGNSYIYGLESGTNTAFTTATNVIDNISLDEIVYWSPVTYYDYENSKNQYNSTIRVLDSAYSTTVSNNLKTLLT